MAQWDNYSVKTTPADTDTLMLKDNSATGKPNKRVLFSGLWTWIVGKLASAVIDTLTTNPKTVTGGMNALQTAVTSLNSKTTVSDASITLNYTVVNGAVYVRKFGNVVTVIIATKPSNETNIPAGNALFVIPQGYRPPIYLETVFRYGSNYPIVGVYDNGNVMASTAITGGTWIYATITYIVS